jgi:ethanolamine-phosphate cytidylyltransferase
LLFVVSTSNAHLGKWVDEVAFGVPYSPTIELLDSLNCDFAVHGDDMPTNAEGTSAYDEVIKAGRCKIIKRTEGVSTTSLVGRLLLMTREHHLPDKSSSSNTTISISEFLPTVQRLYQFSKYSDANYTNNANIERVVYIDGAFDLFHVGHVEILKKAKALGDFLLVGIHEDKVVNSYMGKNYPIMNSYERVLNVLSSKYVDEVILAAPRSITLEMINTMNIKGNKWQ